MFKGKGVNLAAEIKKILKNRKIFKKRVLKLFEYLV